MALSQAILGIRPDYDGLVIAPCLPDCLTEYTVERKFRDCTYRIHVKKTGRPSLRVDGEPLPGNLVPAAEERDGVRAVEVEI